MESNTCALARRLQSEVRHRNATDTQHKPRNTDTIPTATSQWPKHRATLESVSVRAFGDGEQGNPKTTLRKAKAMSESIEEMQAEILRLKAANAVLSTPRKLTLKVSPKGAVSVYGMGQFPVTLYQSQWERLGQEMPTIKAFILAHSSELKLKGEVRA